MKIDIQTVTDDIHFIDFIDSRDIRETTKKHYAERLTRFCIFIGKTPTQLIEEAEDEEENGVRMKKRKIRQYINNMAKHMKDTNKSDNYIKSMLTTIRAFYSQFDIELPKDRRKRKHYSQMTTKDIVAKEHIKKALEYSNLKYKAIILLMSSSGMGQSEIMNLKYGDFLNAISDYYKPSKNEQFDVYQINDKLQDSVDEIVGLWHIKRYKTDMPYFTFSSPESIRYILLYLLERIKQNRQVSNLDDWLFETVGNKLNKSVFVKYFQDLNDHCEFGYVGRSRFFTSHKLRKYFASTLYSKGLPQLTVDWFLGHRIDTVTDAYFKPDIDSLRNQYLGILKDLSIVDYEVKTLESLEFKELKEKYEKDSKAKDEKMEKMDKELKLIKELLGDKEFAEERTKEN